MKAIMISIQPQWVEKILNGEKTIEIRKTKPKCELPCKVYIYSTKSQEYLLDLDYTGEYFCWNKKSHHYPFKFHKHEFGEELHGLYEQKVVAEFTLNNVDEFSVFESGSVQYWNCYNLEKSGLSYDDIAKYIGYDKKYGYRNGYAWHIDNLKIYDEPKELSEFGTDCMGENHSKCKKCKYYSIDYSEDGTYECCHCNNLKPIEKAPQSWCYVEEL